MKPNHRVGAWALGSALICGVPVAGLAYEDGDYPRLLRWHTQARQLAALACDAPATDAALPSDSITDCAAAAATSHYGRGYEWRQQRIDDAAADGAQADEVGAQTPQPRHTDPTRRQSK